MIQVSFARGRFGLPMVLLACAGVVIASYLTWQHFAGAIPPCGPVRGCETVLTSQYSVIAGIPVSLPGTVVSLATLGGSLVWWVRADRQALVVAYLAGMASLAVLAYLTSLELFVLHAICAWCATYALTVLAGWILSLAAYRSSARA